jgi:O-antigen/teichoic acid export membrane protein
MGWLYQAMEDYFYITVRSLCFQVISVVLLFTLVRTKEDYLWYASVNIISNVGANVLNFIHSRKYVRFDFSCLELKKHLKPIFILFASAIAGTVFSSIDTTMLGFMSGDIEVGLYSAGVKIIHMINGIFPALIIVVFPRVSYYLANNDEEKIQALSVKTINCLLCFAVPIAAGLFLLMEPLVLLFCGQKFYDAVTISKILCPYLVFSALGHFFGSTMLVAYGKEKLQLYAMTGACLCDIILNAIFISTYGANGAAFATLITQILLTAFFVISLFELVKKLHFKKSAFQFILASAVMSVAVYFVRGLFENMLLKLFVSFAAGVMVYAFMLFVLRNRFFLEYAGLILRKVLHKNSEPVEG